MERLPSIPAGYEQRVGRHGEASELVDVEGGTEGRCYQLAPGSADAWNAMWKAAAEDGVELQLISAFRSVARQTEIVRRKLEAGQSFEEILRVSAYPGFSEHHTGRAVDIGSPGCEPFSEAFEQTREFQWLERNAMRDGFVMSYGRNNGAGFAYEPWHWCQPMMVESPVRSI